MIEDFITLQSGTTHVVDAGIDAGIATNHLYQNTDLAKRMYSGMVFQGRYALTNRWTVQANYTLQLKNEGNYEGEGTNTPGATSRIGDYPQAYPENRYWPTGTLQDFERHRLRAWTIYNFGLGRMGDMSVSGLLRVDSGQAYSIRQLNVPPTAQQRAILRAAGYPDLPGNSSVYFGDRGTENFNGYGVVDANLSYNIPVFGSVRPWVKLDVYNLLNNDKQITWNTTVRQDPNSPLDQYGLRTGYVKAATFGTNTSQAQFIPPFGGATGLRTFRVAVGIRF